MIELRDYQIEMLDRLQRTWREGKRSVMVQMPTGTGKTVLLAEVLRSLTPDPSTERKSLSPDPSTERKSLSPDPSPKREGRKLARSGALEELENEKIKELCSSEGQAGDLEELKNEDFKELKSPFGGVLIVAHRRELLGQIRETLKASALSSRGSVTTLGKGDDIECTPTECPIYVESIQKLSRHLEEVEMEPSLVVIDEAHHALAKTYRALWERWPRAKFLGLTATPCRLDGTAFTDLFDVLLQSKDIQWFIREGWLSDFEYVSVLPDSEEMQKVKGLRKRGADGDYQTKEMATVLDVPESIEHLYNTYNIYARGKKGIVYAIDRAHAQHIAEYYSAHGVRCAVIDAKTPAKERAEVIGRYKGEKRGEKNEVKENKRNEKDEVKDKNEVIDDVKDKNGEGGIDVLINVDIFSEGFDCPEVEFIQLARPTLSLSKYLQQVGRGMRVTPGRPYVTILDQVGLYQTFGLPTDNRDWSLMFQGRISGKGDANGVERPLIIRDEVADKELVNMEMLHIKRFNEKRTRIEVFLQHGCFGIMRLGHVTCAPQFRRVQRLRHAKYYALAQYEGQGTDITTVIDSEGQDMRLRLQGEVSVDGDIFIERSQDGGCMYYDAVSGQTYNRFPQFMTLAGIEVEKLHDEFYLRDRQNAMIIYLSKDGTHYNDHIVVSDNVLINKEEGNRQSRVQGFLGDSVLVAADKGVGYQAVTADGRRGESFAVRPKEATVVPDWKRMGMRSLSAELREERQHALEHRLLTDCRAFMEAMVRRDQVWQDDNLAGSFQATHDGHTASRPEFIIAGNVRFHKIETLSVEVSTDGDRAVFTGRIRVSYQLLPSRRSGTEFCDFRLRMGKDGKGGWRFTRAWFGRSRLHT